MKKRNFKEKSPYFFQKCNLNKLGFQKSFLRFFFFWGFWPKWKLLFRINPLFFAPPFLRVFFPFFSLLPKSLYLPPPLSPKPFFGKAFEILKRPKIKLGGNFIKFFPPPIKAQQTKKKIRPFWGNQVWGGAKEIFGYFPWAFKPPFKKVPKRWGFFPLSKRRTVLKTKFFLELEKGKGFKKFFSQMQKILGNKKIPFFFPKFCFNFFFPKVFKPVKKIKPLSNLPKIQQILKFFENKVGET